ncbi:MAG: tRNA uridine-5-carboxymethylaminomethyl(34) synthesis enzyme MnmG [Clostridia bacterium]|jgi:tRNA uridine 5-carboxymethylaminomethyl modification enzyme|nr:tRNA uridine-5-carboxymethylaminomethyl(34) synthesis enzyme MnmG [Clostridia bacterium]MDD4275372.1 tRNA uridine-5-carboxymethylaminomethyl(34) synthesis enzyme MnmG [Clostridia bacterium]
MNIKNEYEAVIIGSGHAGCEAALALSKMGHKTLLLTLNLDSIAFLACNPSIGGTAKGQLVSEIDALGGQMGISADQTTIQAKMLNEGKGAAVQSLRVQIDKVAYHINMKSTLEAQKNLDIVQAEAVKIKQKKGKVNSVVIAQGAEYFCKIIIVCTGVYLKAKIIMGEFTQLIGPSGFAAANKLTKSLINLGLEIRRFKTGTPCRLDGSTINFSELEEQVGDENVQNFSYITKRTQKNRAKCYLTYTNDNTHKIILDNLSRAPMYSGDIKGIGPRYCPSIETKIVKFADKERHQIFLEPESLSTKEIYMQGASTSMPVDIQQKIVNSVKGLENTKIMRNAYAIEYDCINSLQLLPTLEYKNVHGLYFAGQINGTSGYEEAACQGLIAAINGALMLEGKSPLILKRSDAYIGVLIDDLVTKGTNEPYRMMTSRAEYRLHLRQDNTAERLTQIGKNVGLVNEKRYKLFKKMQKNIKNVENLLKKVILPNEELKNLFLSKNSEMPENGLTIENLLKRTDFELNDLIKHISIFKTFELNALKQVSITIKYGGYLKRQLEQIEEFKKQENTVLSFDFNYKAVKGLRIEAMQKLSDIKPLSIGQASRISGVSPADISVLSIYLKLQAKGKKK